jgi:hypothetical protein
MAVLVAQPGVAVKALDLSDEQRLSIAPSDIELRFAR